MPNIQYGEKLSSQDKRVLKLMYIREDFADWLIDFADKGGDWRYAIQKPWKYIDEFRNWLEIEEEVESYDEDYE